MPSHRPVPDFLRGMRDSLPILVSAAPFGVLFGMLALENGFTVAEAMFMSALIYGGSSQMVGIELFGQNVAPWVIVFSILAVNFRHVLYSAAFGRRIGHWSGPKKVLAFFMLTDPQYAVSETRKDRLSFAWYMGVALPSYTMWVSSAGIGAIFGQHVPDTHALGLDFLLPIYFLGLVMSFRGRPMWLPVVLVSGLVAVLAYLTVGSPWHVSIGAVAGVALAASMPVGGVGETGREGARP